MSTACGRPQWGVKLMWMHVDRGRGQKSRFSCGRHKWMALREAYTRGERINFNCIDLSLTKHFFFPWEGQEAVSKFHVLNISSSAMKISASFPHEIDAPTYTKILSLVLPICLKR